VVNSTPPRPGKASSLAAQRRRSALIAWIFVAPFVLTFGVFGMIPLVSSLAMSFTDLRARDIRNPFNVDFVGFANFITVLTDESFLHALRNTLLFVVIGVPATMFIALVLAVLLNSLSRRVATFFRVGYYMPVITTIVAVAIVWRLMYQDTGVINTILGWIGISGPNWLSDPHTALLAITVMAIWRNIGGSMVIFLAGLQSIPSEINEAASIDGADARQKFFRVTIPMMMPTILLNTILITTGYMQFFDEPFVMTNGGPLDSTTSIALQVYNQFKYGNYSVGAAGAYVLFVLVGILAIVQFRFFRQRT